jgi:hypothetical protein
VQRLVKGLCVRRAVGASGGGHRFRDAANEGTLKHTVDSVIKEGAGKHSGFGVGVRSDVGSGLWWQQQSGIVGFVRTDKITRNGSFK